MSSGSSRRWAVVAALAVALAVGVGAAGAVPVAQATPVSLDQDTRQSTVDADWHTLETPSLADGQFEIITLSTLPDTVTGGDVLVAIRGLGEGEPFTARAGKPDVTGAFSYADGEYRGLVTGLPEGTTTLTVRSGPRVARLDIVNHPVTGPVISGPHQDPFFCRTAENGLGEPLDEDCSAQARFDWYYRSAFDQGFHRLDDPNGGYPDDVATTETEDGRAVPFVVRVESRTINRGIARIAVLDDPAARGPDAPFDALNWNERIYYLFGESCGVGYHQGTNSPEVVLGGFDLAEIDAENLLVNLTGQTARLGSGDVIVHSTLSTFGVHCNPLVSIETTMMIKEHINETYGLIDQFIGTNGSGAALQQYNAANNAPGLLTGAMPSASFADIVTTAMTVTDCGLLNHYFATTSMDWSTGQKAAVTGHNLQTSTDLNSICRSWEDTFLDRVDPTSGCSVPGDQRYDPDSNPTGVRCTIQDANVNIFGTDPETGFARRPLDNVGVQYGRQALASGAISLEQFIDLNETIGGFDIDGNIVPHRHAMSSEVAALTYEVGGVIGRGALAETPIIDVAPYLDLIPLLNIHESVRPFVIRDRLRTHTGQTDTQAIFRGVVTQADLYDIMEDWAAITKENRPAHGGDHMQAVIDSKPASAADHCTFGTIGGQLDLSEVTAPLGLVEVPLVPGSGVDAEIPFRVDVPEDFESGLGACSQLLPPVDTPRIAAGMSQSDDVIKCQLRPVDAADFPGASADQISGLQAVFPDGVCDYTKPAAEDVERSLLWVSIGGEQLEEPHELTWRVGRSTVVPASRRAAVPASASGSEGGNPVVGTLANTGGSGLGALAVVALVAAFLSLRAARRPSA